MGPQVTKFVETCQVLTPKRELLLPASIASDMRRLPMVRDEGAAAHRSRQDADE